MSGSHPPLTTHLIAVPLPRRPLDLAAFGDDPVRRWYENELGWPTVPASTPESPLRLHLGLRFDVLDVPAEAGRAALRHLADCSPVAVRGDRMLLLVAAGSADELPGILEWLEWGPLPLDLRALGTNASMTAPTPPERAPGGLDREAQGPGGPAGTGWGRPPGSGGLAEATHRLSGPGAAWGEVPDAGRIAGATAGPGRGVPCSPGPETTGLTGTAAQGRVPAPGGSAGRSSASGTGGHVAAAIPGGDRDAEEPLPPGRPDALQGAAVWLRPPEPGCEVEASLPTVSALGGVGTAPDLVRVVNTVATQCHRLRLRRARP